MQSTGQIIIRNKSMYKTTRSIAKWISVARYYAMLAWYYATEFLDTIINSWQELAIRVTPTSRHIAVQCDTECHKGDTERHKDDTERHKDDTKRHIAVQCDTEHHKDDIADMERRLRAMVARFILAEIRQSSRLIHEENLFNERRKDRNATSIEAALVYRDKNGRFTTKNNAVTVEPVLRARDAKGRFTTLPDDLGVKAGISVCSDQDEHIATLAERIEIIDDLILDEISNCEEEDECNEEEDREDDA